MIEKIAFNSAYRQKNVPQSTNSYQLSCVSSLSFAPFFVGKLKGQLVGNRQTTYLEKPAFFVEKKVLSLKIDPLKLNAFKLTSLVLPACITPEHGGKHEQKLLDVRDFSESFIYK